MGPRIPRFGLLIGVLKSTWTRTQRVTTSLLDQALVVGATFLANVFLARYGTKEEYGLFVLSYTIYTLLAGIHNALIIEPFSVLASGEYKKAQSEYLRYTILLHIRLCLIIAILLLTAFSIGNLAGYNINLAFLGLSLAITFIFSGAFIRRVYYANEQVSQALSLSLTYFFLMLVSLLSIQLFNQITGFFAYIAMATAWVICISIHYYNNIHKIIKTTSNTRTSEWIEHKKYSKWTLPTAFVFQLTNQGYYWIIIALLTSHNLAEFRAIHNIILPIDLFIVSLSLLYLPRMAKSYAINDNNTYRRLIMKFLTSVLILGISFAIFITIFGTTIIDMLYDGKYKTTLSIIIPLCLAPIAMGLGQPFNNALKAAKKPHLVFASYIIAGTCTFLIGIPLISSIGLTGASIGMLISASAFSVSLFIFYKFYINSNCDPVLVASPPSSRTQANGENHATF